LCKKLEGAVFTFQIKISGGKVDDAVLGQVATLAPVFCSSPYYGRSLFHEQTRGFAAERKGGLAGGRNPKGTTTFNRASLRYAQSCDARRCSPLRAKWPD
jgi:hypothetical protein